MVLLTQPYQDSLLCRSNTNPFSSLQKYIIKTRFEVFEVDFLSARQKKAGRRQKKYFFIITNLEIVSSQADLLIIYLPFFFIYVNVKLYKSKNFLHLCKKGT